MNVVGNALTGNNSIKRNRVFIRKYCQIVPKSIVIETLFDSNSYNDMNPIFSNLATIKLVFMSFMD